MTGRHKIWHKHGEGTVGALVGRSALFDSALVALVLALVLSLVGCGGGERQTIDESVGVETPTISESGGVETPAMNQPTPLPEYPIIDGSSSTVFMHAAIRAYLTDEHFVDSHSQTYEALERIIPGSDDPADVILAVKYYDETLQDAKNRGADLVITPIAKEGFVFVLHKDNPVDSLTRQQLRDIYLGKITNWKEVGGQDETIVPYVRNDYSGSQTAMADFMAGEAVVGEEVSSMMDVLTQVQESGSAAIGYNIFSWSARQGLDEFLDLKALAVEGVRPENESLSDGSYPLMVYTYSYYDSDNEKGRALTDWLLTAEGQSVIASADYVGVFGEMPPSELPDFYKDEMACQTLIEDYYVGQGFDRENWYLGLSRLTDREMTQSFSNGQGKDVTAMYLVNLYESAAETDDNPGRFIVLTREKGKEFEVINEGEYLS
jgi:ABC-type phosphate transport system substrate-binding protein